jgi:2-amino-4-hydroxy-6-hydroxymethyldihydropteridine diphosphokinase
MAERAFVLLPLAELASSLEIPGIGRVSRLLDGIDATACTRID